MYYPWDSLTVVASPRPGVVVVIGCVGGMSAARVAVIVVVGNTLSWGCAGRVSAAFVASTSGLHCCDVYLQIDVSHQWNMISTHFFIFMGLRQGSETEFAARAYEVSSHAQQKLLRPPPPAPCAQVPAATSTTHSVLQCFSWESHAPTTTHKKAPAIPSYLPPHRGSDDNHHGDDGCSHSRSRAPRRRQQQRRQAPNSNAATNPTDSRVLLTMMMGQGW
ncbi:hypothetical protein EDB89DRAFT_2249986 [Lactarius sanguifluus]|nr:hypothetical protein EDB89DRAFT_2249986 [Lactarius sanguifluus]